MQASQGLFKKLKSQWHHIYYVLAAFDLLVICLTLYLSHTHLVDYSTVVESNSKAMQVLNSTSTLLGYAQKANAPGNDIFDSHDVKKEKHLYTLANKEYDQQFISLHELLLATSATEEVKGQTKNQITAIQESMNNMREVAEEIFLYFSIGDQNKAGKLMAEMDRRYGVLLKSIAAVSSSRVSAQAQLLEAHKERLVASQEKELIYSLMVLFAVFGVALYGSRMSRFVKKSGFKNAQLAGIVSSSSDAIISHSLNGHITSWNQGAGTIFGYTEQEAIGQHISFLSHFPNLEREFKNFDKNNQGKRITKLGKIIEVSFVVSPLCGERGELLGHSEIIRDITEQKLAESKFQYITESMHDGFVIQDSMGKIIQFNTAAKRILGLSEEQLLGKTSFDPNWKSIKEDGSQFIGDEHPAMLALKTGKSFSGVVMGLCLPKALEPRWIRINAVPLEGVGGRSVVVTFSDITEQVKSNEDIKRIFSNSMDLMCIVSMDGFFKRVSPSFKKILGFSEAEMLNKSFSVFLHEEDLEATNKVVFSLSQGIALVNFENRFRTASGEYRRISWVCEPDIKTGLLYATGRDVTLSRELEVQNSEILKSIDVSAIVAFTDSSGKITKVNDNFCKISGYSESELLGQDHRLLNSKTHTTDFFKTLWKTIRSGNVWTGDIKNIKKNGEFYFVRTVIAPIKSVDGVIKQYMAIRFDVTKQMKIESSLLEVQEIAKIGTWSFNLATQEIEWSKKMYDLFPENILNGPPSFEKHFSTIHPDDQINWKQTVETCMQTGSPYKMKFRSVSPEKTIWLEAYGAAIRGQDGKVLSLAGTCQDISDTVLAEEELSLERSKSMQSAKLASLGEMSAGIAHEINNPLAVICGNIALLKKFKNDEEKFNAKIESIEKSAGRIEKIVKGLKKFSRNTEGSPYKIESLNSLILEALVITEAKSKRHDCPVTIEATEGLKIICDEVEIEQVIINLINNAIDAVKDIQGRWVKINSFVDREEIVLQVIDAGGGISVDIEKKLFQPFFTTKKVGEGTGLGLSISKGILDNHKATFGLNRSFKNTCFEIRFAMV